MLTTFAYASLQLAAFGLVLGALEWCYPNRPRQRRFRSQLATDLAFYFGQHMLWLGLELTVLIAIRSLLAPLIPNAWFFGQPWWLCAIEIILVGDLLTYWFHRASHEVSWLWAFHRVHHSSIELDFLAAHREHPVDGMLTQIAMNLPALALGVSTQGIAWLIVFRGVWATFIHSNVRLPIGPLRVLVGAPELHHWHHAAVEKTEHNFSNLAPWTDVLFGTYYCPMHQRHVLGMPGQPVRSYLGWITSPWRAGTSSRGSSPSSARP
ncbi:MAG TPA: sterol desaturase family protein [Kofleriaceae bacterium]|jgi:sterol desaturase/sphingolipid hydroxylase (fatty acid hydroxylase superfamily)|nr:sterol desaturase family protein [Kofleriaceae bacterium]